MDLAMGAMGSLLPKLIELLNDEYKLQKSVKEGIKSLEKEMKSMHAALRKVAEVPRDQLDEQVKLWAGEVRDLSFDMEDVIDKFLVRVDEPASSNKLKRLSEKMAGLFSKGKARHQIADAIKDINKQVQEVANRRGRYNLDSIVVMPPPVTTIDPRLKALYTQVTELVGIAGKRDEELMKLLSEGDNNTKNKLKIVSVVGFGGLGKTTLVKTVYDKIKGDFDCTAFVSVGRNAEAKKILLDILIDLDMYESKFTILDERQLIKKLQESLKNKRCLIVIDDLWDENVWTIINLAFPTNNNCGSQIITTTRIVSVSKFCCSTTNDSVYQMEPLSADDSQRLFYRRIFSHESGCPSEFEEVSMDILKKCGGVPLAIITIASLLTTTEKQHKPLAEWHALFESIGRGLTEDPSVEEMLKILSFSYYDLPSHLKTCLLYLSMFPEDHKIKIDRLIWMWIAENFVVQFEKAKPSLFETGEKYFNELVNRNMIMPVYDEECVRVVACRVHDMVLDLISSLSSEDNFVIALHGTADRMSSQSNARRLSLQNARELQTTPLKSASVFQVRSVATFDSGIDLMPCISSFVVLRVLDLSGCYLGSRYKQLKLRELGSLLHLRYLGLANTGLREVPEEVGKLRFLQVLDLWNNSYKKLPSTIINLGALMFLTMDPNIVMFPAGFGKLTSMEVLVGIRCDSVSIMKELSGMEKLRELGIRLGYVSLEMEEAFVEWLVKLSDIQRLTIGCRVQFAKSMDLFGERWMPPQSLQKFRAVGNIIFSTLPAWIRRDPSYLWQLSELLITVDIALEEDLDILGRLPALRSLELRCCCCGLLLVHADGFRCLVSFYLDSRFTRGKIMFQPGAMLKAEIVKLYIDIGVGGFSDMGMENLPSLRKVHIRCHHYKQTIDLAHQATAALENTLSVHPNHPTFDIELIPGLEANTFRSLKDGSNKWWVPRSDDDDVCSEPRDRRYDDDNGCSGESSKLLEDELKLMEADLNAIGRAHLVHRVQPMW